MKWSKLTPHQKNTRIKMVIFFALGSWLSIQWMGIYDTLTLAGMFGTLIGVVYLYEYIKKRFKKN